RALERMRRTHAAQQPRGCVRDDRVARMAPYHEIDRRVADVVVPALAVARMQQRGLAPASEVAHAVAREDLVEAADVCGYLACEALVGRAAEQARATRVVAQPREHAFVVGQ